MLTFWIFWVTIGGLALSGVAALALLLANELEKIKIRRTQLATARVQPGATP